MLQVATWNTWAHLGVTQVLVMTQVPVQHCILLESHHHDLKYSFVPFSNESSFLHFRIVSPNFLIPRALARKEAAK